MREPGDSRTRIRAEIKERAEIEEVARRKATYNLEPEGFALVEELISRPPAPTDALYSLMAADAAGAEVSTRMVIRPPE